MSSVHLLRSRRPRHPYDRSFELSPELAQDWLPIEHRRDEIRGRRVETVVTPDVLASGAAECP